VGVGRVGAGGVDINVKEVDMDVVDMDIVILAGPETKSVCCQRMETPKALT